MSRAFDFTQPRFRIANVTLADVLTDGGGAGLRRADLVIASGRIQSVEHPGAGEALPSFDAQGGMLLPCFVDVHTHLDKGHIAPRRENSDGTFMGAIMAVKEDRERNWSARDVRGRMEFALRCAYAYGTRALRTHLDSIPPQDAITWPIFAELREEWRGRIELQAVALMGADQLVEPAILRSVAQTVRQHGGLIGGAMASHPRMDEAIRAVIAVATKLDLDIDLHLDETQDPQSGALRLLADAVLDTGFKGKVTAGHCCSLARQESDEARRTIERVAKAGINIVSLPMCNLYLQDRGDGSVTPRYRGVTLIRELLTAGVNVSTASDNTRDPFYAYGDLDGLEVLRESVRIAHLDHPLDAAPALVTRNPARVMSLSDAGMIAPGVAADFILLRGRDWSEVLSRPETQRMVFRNGQPIDAQVPDYRELDELMGV